MRRILSAALAAVLLVLSIADIGIWIRGYRTGDTLVYRSMPNPTTLRFMQIWSACGGLRIMRGTQTYPPEGAQFFSWATGFHHGAYGGPKYPTEIWGEGEQWGGFGFYYYRLLESPHARFGRSYRGITIPHALLAALLALHPISFLWNFRRRRLRRLRTQRGLCIHCGYDLRGVSDRCPECGSLLESKNFN